jgi:hypothetical protein
MIRFHEIFLKKKDLSLHFTVEVEVPLFEHGEVPLSCAHF